MYQGALVRLILPGYNNFSLSLSDKLPDIVDPMAGGEPTSDALGSCAVATWTVVAIAASSSGIVFAGAGDGEAGAPELVPLFDLVGVDGADKVGKP